MSLTVISEVLERSEARGADRLVAIVLAETAHHDGVGWLDQETIAGRARVSVREVKRALKALEETDEIERRTAQRGRRRIGVFRIVVGTIGQADVDYERLPFVPNKPFATRGRSVPPSAGDEGTSATSLIRGTRTVLSKDLVVGGGEDGDNLVREAWLAKSPPLPLHRAAYFGKPKVLTAVKNAMKVYPADDVAAAIANYATVLASRDHFWSHRWTFQEFLDRGLDKFVVEADPLSNFRVRRDADAQGQRQRTPVEQLQTAEAWILATAWRLPLDEYEIAEQLGQRGVEGPDRTRLLDLWRSKRAA